MKKILLALRILETFFLISVCGCEITHTGIKYFSKIALLHLSFGISWKEDTIIISTILIGYIFSFLGTLVHLKIQKHKLIKLSFTLSLLGIISYANELLRLIQHYPLQILLSFAIILLIIDWKLYVDLKKYK